MKRATKRLPYNEWIKLDSAAGIATLGWLKFSRARTTPSPEFCIPTSIAIVLATVAFLKMRKQIKKPKRKPRKCNNIRASINWNPEERIISLPCPIILATIKMTNVTAAGGAKGIILFVIAG